MKKTLKRLCTGFLALATIVTALPTTPVHAESKGTCHNQVIVHIFVTQDFFHFILFSFPVYQHISDTLR